MTVTRSRVFAFAKRMLSGITALNEQFGPLFTGSMVLLVLGVAIAVLSSKLFLIGVAGVAAIAMGIWVMKAGAKPEPEPTEFDAEYDPLKGADERTK